MTDQVIPDEIRQFLLKNIDSIAQWEGLLMLRAHSEKEWSAEAVAQSIYTNEQDMAQLLTQLAARDILATIGNPSGILYQYRPKDSELAQMIERAANLYRGGYLIPITHIIHSKSKNRVQEFADAFRLRKD